MLIDNFQLLTFNFQFKKVLSVWKKLVFLHPLSQESIPIVLWCNGSTSDSGSACLGSNPGRTTKSIPNKDALFVFFKTSRHRDIETYRHKDLQTQGLTDTRTHRHKDSQTQGLTDTRTHRHKDSQTPIVTNARAKRYRQPDFSVEGRERYGADREMVGKKQGEGERQRTAVCGLQGRWVVSRLYCGSGN